MIFSCGLSCATRFYFAWEDRIIKAQNQLNGEIRDREIRVISSTGEQLGIMTPREALRLATHKLPCKCKVVSRADLEGGVSNEN